MPGAEVGNGSLWPGLSQDGGALPIVTNPGDQTKNHRVLHVEHPTKPYRILCSRCESAWCVWLGQGSAYQVLPITRSGWASILLHYYQSLPAAVLNTHNDIKHTVLHPDSGPTGMGLVHPERHQSLEVDTHHTHDPASTHGQGPTWLTPRPLRTATTAQILCAKQHNLVMIS